VTGKPGTSHETQRMVSGHPDSMSMPRYIYTFAVVCALKLRVEKLTLLHGIYGVQLTAYDQILDAK